MEWKLVDFEDICNKITGIMMWVATYGVFILLTVGVILGIME